MNDSKKLIIVRIVVIFVIALFVSLYIFLIIKIDIYGHLFRTERFTIESTSSNLTKYIDRFDGREFKEIKKDKHYEEPEKKIQEKEVIDKSIFKNIDAIKKSKKSFLSLFNKDNAKHKEQNISAISTKSYIDYKATQELNRIQSIYDKGYYPKDSWLFIEDDGDYYSYNYYFDDKGKLLYDTVTPDYRVVDKYGREVNDDLEPILYKVDMANIIYSTPNEIQNERSLSQVIISPGADINKKSKYYNNQMNRNVIEYIDKSLRFRKITNGTIFDGTKWKAASSLIDDGGYVIFNNPKNNFNKIIGKVTTQKMTDKEESDLTLYVYDADLYDMYQGYEDYLEPLFITSAFNNTEPLDFSFTFFRTVKRLRFQVESDDNKKYICYLKDLKYGFNNAKYKEELEEARLNKEYIEYLKRLDIYKSDEDFINDLKSLEEDSQSDYLEYEDFNDIDLYMDVDLSDYYRNLDKEQMIIDRKTGPAFDEYLRSLKNFWEIEYGPGFLKE